MIKSNKENINILNKSKNLEKRDNLEEVRNKIERVLRKKLSKLDLSNCEIDDSMIKFFLKKLSLIKQVKILKMNGNWISENGFKYLLKGIKNLNVEYLYM